MIRTTIVIGLTMCLACGCSASKCAGNHTNAAKINIIPKPVEMTAGKGLFRIDTDTKIYAPTANTEAEQIAEYLAEMVKHCTGSGLKIIRSRTSQTESNAITFHLEHRDDLGSEGYILSVRPDSILITASHPAGMFYAVQTIRQMLPEQIEDTTKEHHINLSVPCIYIKDRPAFVWRGLLLDCSRVFLEKNFLLRYIDLLALYKMNILQLHLTDDQGWRIEIKKYPELTELCSEFSDRYPDAKGGYYSQDDIKEMVEYARRRYVTVVPEIEMPGHSSSVFVAYPHLSCRGEKTEIFPFFKGPTITKDIFCAGNEDVYAFLENVLGEVVEMFPSEYIHIGGDEAPKDRWKECPKCQAVIARHNLADEEHLQAYFTQRIEHFLNSKGRKLIGWDEILEGGLAKNAAVMSWRGTVGGIKAARMSHYVVMSPTSACYFDYDIRTTPLKETYLYNPVPAELPSDKRKFILGGQGNMWTQSAPTETAIDKHTFPRLIGLAEALWTPAELKDFDDFHNRLGAHYRQLDIMHVKYGPEK